MAHTPREKFQHLVLQMHGDMTIKGFCFKITRRDIVYSIPSMPRTKSLILYDTVRKCEQVNIFCRFDVLVGASTNNVSCCIDLSSGLCE